MIFTTETDQIQNLLGESDRRLTDGTFNCATKHFKLGLVYRLGQTSLKLFKNKPIRIELVENQTSSNRTS